MKIITKYGCPECGNLYDTICKARDCILECVMLPEPETIDYCEDCKHIEIECTCEEKSEWCKQYRLMEAAHHTSQRKLI